MKRVILKKDILVLKRRAKSLFNNYKLFFILLIFLLPFIIKNFISLYLANVALITAYQRTSLLFISLIFLAKGLFSKQIQIKCPNGDIFYLDEKDLRDKFKGLFQKRIFYNLILSIIMGIFISKRERTFPNIIFLWLTINLSTFINVNKYCGYNKLGILGTLFGLLLTFLYFSSPKYSWVFIVLLLGANTLFFISLIKINLPREKYFQDMKAYYYIQSAARENDLYKMQKISSSFSARKTRKFTYFRPLSYKNALFDTVLLTFRRTKFKVYIYMILGFILILLASKIFIGNKYFDFLMFFIFLINTRDLIENHLKNLESKSTRALFITNSTNKMNIAYLKTHLLFTCPIFLASLITGRTKLGLVLISYLLFNLLGLFLRKTPINQRSSKFLINLLALITAYIIYLC